MKIVSLLFLLFVSLTLVAQDITGKWYGYPDLKNMRLRLEYHVEKAGDGYQVTLKIPDLSEKTYRADAVELADHVLTVNIAEAQTRSILRLQADGSLKGTFLWEGYDFELLLTRTPVVFKRPQTPKEPFSYHSEEVTFQNADDGVTLAGTLTWRQVQGRGVGFRQWRSGSQQHFFGAQDFFRFGGLSGPSRDSHLACG